MLEVTAVDICSIFAALPEDEASFIAVSTRSRMNALSSALAAASAITLAACFLEARGTLTIPQA